MALLAVASLAAVVASPWIAAVGVLAVVLATVVDGASIRRPPVLRRSVPAELVRGVAAPLRIDVDARGRRVQVRQPQTAELRIEPATAAGDLAATITASHRGAWALARPVTRTVGPLGLCRWVHGHGEEQVVAVHADLPGARRIARAVQQGRFREEGRRRGPLGLGTDFESVREYTPDDDIRRMNWRATERTGRPMVNQYREDTERELWCLVDAGRLLASPVGDRTRLDAALDALAAVAATADVLGDRVGAIVFDGEVKQVVAPRRGAAGSLVRSLDLLEPSLVDTDYDAAFARVGGAKRALVLVFTDLLDVAAGRGLVAAVPVLARRHAVVVAGVRDPDLVAAVTVEPERWGDLQRAAVARDLLDERATVVGSLRRAGAVVVEQPVDGFPSACVGAYLQLKASARL